MSMSMSRFTLLGVGLAAIGCRASTAPVPTSAQTNAYVLRLGNDTIAVDQATRVGDRIEGTLVTHLPRTVVTRYVVTVNPTNGMAQLLEYNTRLPDGSLLPAANQPSVRNVTITFGTDSAVSQVRRDTLITTRAAARNAFPYINYAIAFFQLPVSALRAANVDSAAYAIYTGGRQATPMHVVRRGSNRYAVVIQGYPYDIVTDGKGVVQTVDGARTTQHFVATRQNSVDVAGLSAIWAQRERDSRPATVLSVRDTTRATVGPAELWVDYGRPTTRGRKVFGPTGVLNDTIWRTGANAATQFRTNVPLTIAGQTVPAGTYTLWTLAVPGRYQLIINKQVGQWGTVYDPKQDLVRVPLSVSQLPQVVDRFTIAVDPTGGNAGVLRLRWDTTELSVPFSVP
jgi:hypothetical protein